MMTQEKTIPLTYKAAFRNCMLIVLCSSFLGCNCYYRQPNQVSAGELTTRGGDVNFLNGYWINTYESRSRQSGGQEKVFIDKGNYYVVENSGLKWLAFKITEFNFDHETGAVFFIKEKINQTEPYENGNFRFNVNRLKINGTDLSGEENGVITIKYRRINN